MVRNAGWLGGLWSRQAMEPTDQAEPLIAAQVFCRRTPDWGWGSELISLAMLTTLHNS